MASSNTVTIDVVADTTSAIRSINTLSSSITKTLAGLTATVAAAVVSIGKESLEAYSDYEQLVDGIAIMFGDSADQLLENANNAFSSAQVSANSYLESVSDFGMLLINSLDGDTEAAVGYVEMALEDMADISNAFGLELEEVADVYKSLSRGIYRTLDNLQLGYAGTKTGLEALIEDANEYAETIGETGDLTADSYADIIQAIDYIIEKQGLAGIAAYEATETLQGSLNTLQAVWENWLLGLADEDADLSQLTENLVVGLENVAKNVLPRIEQIGEGLAAALPEAVSNAAATVAPMLAESIAAIWNTASALLSECTSIDIGAIDASDVEDTVASIGEVFQGLWEKVEPVIAWLVDTAVPTVVDALGSISEYIPDAAVFAVFATGLKTVFDAIGEIAKSDVVTTVLPGLFTTLSNAFSIGVNTGGIAGLGDALNYVFTAVKGLVNPIYLVIAAVVGAVAVFASWYESSEEFRDAVNGLVESIMGLVSGIGEALSPLISSIIGLVQSLYEYVEPVVAAIIELISGAVEAATPYIASIVTSVSETLAPIISWLSTVLIPVISSIATMLIELLSPIINTIITTLLPGLAGEIAIISAAIQAAWVFVESVLNAALLLVEVVFAAIWNAVYPIVYALWTFIFMAFTWIYETISGAVSDAYESVQSAVNDMNEAFQDAVGTITGKVQEIYDGVTGIFDNLVSQASHWGSDLISNIISGITSMASSLVTSVSNVASTIAGYLGFSEPDVGPLSDFHTFMPDMIDLMVEGIENGLSDVQSAAALVAGAVAEEMGGIEVDLGEYSVASLQGIDISGISVPAATTINQTFETKVVRSDSDLYTVAPIIYRNVMREASLV